jgi:hypothetical protein
VNGDIRTHRESARTAITIADAILERAIRNGNNTILPDPESTAVPSLAARKCCCCEIRLKDSALLEPESTTVPIPGTVSVAGNELDVHEMRIPDFEHARSTFPLIGLIRECHPIVNNRRFGTAIATPAVT